MVQTSSMEMPRGPRTSSRTRRPDEPLTGPGFVAVPQVSSHGRSVFHWATRSAASPPSQNGQGSGATARARTPLDPCGCQRTCRADG